MSNNSDIPKVAPECDEIISNRPNIRDPTYDQGSYQSVYVVKQLSKAKFPVYLALSKTTKQNFALKIFPYIEDYSNKYFHNEARFSFLNHPNIIKFLYCEKERTTIHKGKVKKASYILMEYAPYGDFFDFVTKHRDNIDEKLARTYFRQLLDGMEYLHENNVAHLDLKPENLLVGADFNLKIADFDLSHFSGDAKILSRGTRYYRGPEFFRSGSSDPELKVPFAADIYSAGIILFILKSGGIYPHSEDNTLEGVDLADLMYNDNSEFWEKHCEIESRKPSFYNDDFRELFNGMVAQDPQERLTISQVKESKWYNGPVYTPEEMNKKMKKLLKC